MKLFELLLEKDVKKEILMEHIKIINPNKIPSKYISIVEKLPSEMGVYYLHNSNNDIIYIGKSNNIKKRVLSHLTASHHKAISIQKEIAQITYSLTGGELVTLLKEQNEIKNIGPKLNHAMKYRLFPVGILLDNSKGYPIFIIEQIRSNIKYLSVFKNKKAAKITLLKWADEFRICLQKTNLSSDKTACFNYEIKKCDGACIGKESIDDYNLKIESIVESHNYPHKSFLLIDKGKKDAEHSFVYVEDSVFKGYGYHELNHQIKNRDQILSRLIPMDNNPDTQKLIHSFLRRKKFKKLIPLSL